MAVSRLVWPDDGRSQFELVSFAIGRLDRDDERKQIDDGKQKIGIPGIIAFAQGSRLFGHDRLEHYALEREFKYRRKNKVG